jgi:hypothetical protein
MGTARHNAAAADRGVVANFDLFQNKDTILHLVAFQFRFFVDRRPIANFYQVEFRCHIRRAAQKHVGAHCNQ